jgi:signal transduction histidine kinase
VRRVVWGLAGLALVVEWTTSWIHIGMEPVAWGWAYCFGPLYAPWYVLTMVASTTGIVAALRRLQQTDLPGEQGQSSWFIAAVFVPLCIGSISDGLLPLLGFQVPRFGVASFAVLGAVVTASFHRFGWSAITPGSLAGVIFDAIPEGVALVAPNGRVRIANPGMSALLGPASVEPTRLNIAEFLPGIDLGTERDIREGELDLVRQNRDGPERVPVSVSTASLRDKRGSDLGRVLVVRDLGEVVALRRRLLTSARLAAVGELAAGLAHEINNPIAYVKSNLSTLREQWLAVFDAWPGGPDAADPKAEIRTLFEDGLDMLDESLEGVDRTAAIVRDVRNFSHAGGGVAERVDPDESIDRALRMAAHQLPVSVRVLRGPRIEAVVEGVRRELEQVLLNLMVNAAQALEGDGTIRVGAAFRGAEVVISIADDGRGIPPDVVDRIFDPFFTTKPVGEGTGLGLSISHEIVRRHGGRLEVSSQLGRGTEFRVFLPAASLP